MDDVLLNKANIIERCIKRIEEEYNQADFNNNQTRQDAVILNIQRACESAIDMGARIIYLLKADVPQSAREIFSILQQNQIISADLSKKLQAMVGFRNIAVHDYQTLNLDIVASIVESNLDNLLEFCKILLQRF